jgi:hypothetical protein
MTHEFKFAFTSREQFYSVVKFLNHECGKGNWTIKGKVLKGLKRIEQYKQYYSSYDHSIEKVVVIPEDKSYVEAMIRFVHGE